jgi:7 transmembrane receptor (rhodopsin family).
MFNTSILYLTQPVSPKGRFAKITCLLIIDILAILGNSLFLSVACFKQPLRSQSRTYIYFSYVSLTSLTTAIFVIPFPIVSLIYGKWSLGPGLCYFNGFMTTFCLTSCIYSITILSLHKYTSVVLPMQRQFSLNQTFYHCVISFLLSLAITVVPFLESHVYFNPYTGICALSFVKRKTFYTVFIVFGCYAVPTIINISIYVRIFQALRQHGLRLQFNTLYNQASLMAQKRTVHTMYMTFGSFIVGWTPFFVYAILYVTDTVQPNSNLLVVAYFCGFSNSAANPLIFIFRNMRMRSSWKSIRRNRRIPEVKLVSSVSRYGLNEPTSPTSVLSGGSEFDFIENRFAAAAAGDDDVMTKNGSLNAAYECSQLETKSSVKNGDSCLLRTATNAFDFGKPDIEGKTFRTSETLF